MKKVLIVDDDLNLIRQVELTLNEILCQSVGLMEPEFLEAALKRESFDLILLDVHMPSYCGTHILRDLKNNPNFNEIPIIMLTADHNKELLSNCFNLGAVDFITKPIDSMILKSRVNAAIKMHQNIQRMREFVGIVSHDLRSPVGNLMSYCDLLKMEPELLPEYVDDMMITARRAYELVNDLLDLTAMEDGKINVRLEECQVSDILPPIIKEVSPQALQKNVRIQTRLAQSKQSVKADPKRLSQVISNLLRNALKFTHSNGEVTVSSISLTDGLQISIQDNGVGIPKEKQVYLFNKYKKVSTLGTHNEEGTGYGLPLSQEIIQAHNSSIICQSVKGKGSTFSFILRWW